MSSKTRSDPLSSNHQEKVLPPSLCRHLPSRHLPRQRTHLVCAPLHYTSPSNAFGIALCLFFIIELLRVIEIPPFGVVTKFFQIFIDSRDNGVFVLTHISLLLGCAITDWLVDGLEGKQNYIEIVRMLGTIVLGLGDTNV